MSKEKPDAWMPLYIGDWESGTRHLDCEQDGAYGRLVRHYWKNGPLPDDDAMLARIVGMGTAHWRRVRPVLIGFFVIRDGRWFQKRVDEELIKWGKRREKAIEKAKTAAEKRWKKDAPSNATSNQQAMLEECPSSSSTVERASKKALSHSGREAPVSLLGSEPALTPEQLRARIDAENVILMADRQQGSA